MSSWFKIRQCLWPWFVLWLVVYNGIVFKWILKFSFPWSGLIAKWDFGEQWYMHWAWSSLWLQPLMEMQPRKLYMTPVEILAFLWYGCCNVRMKFLSASCRGMADCKRFHTSKLCLSGIFSNWVFRTWCWLKIYSCSWLRSYLWRVIYSELVLKSSDVHACTELRAVVIDGNAGSLENYIWASMKSFCFSVRRCWI